MGGLYRNTSSYKTMPEWPASYTPYNYWGVTGGQDSGGKYFPGFQNDSLLGSSLELILNSSSSDAIVYWNGQGVQVTSGVWGSGYSPSEAWSDADIWACHYMDSVDNKLYSLVIDEGTDPDTYRMASVDKDGTVVLETAAFQVTNTGFNGRKVTFTSTPILYRVGGVDGTGNFRFDLLNANTDNDNSTAPFDGCRLEINTSGGTVNGIAANTMAETTDGLLPNNLYQRYSTNTMLGPTANNIFGGPNQYFNQSISAGPESPHGLLFNMTTGQMTNEVKFGNYTPLVTGTAFPTIKAFNWLGSYHFFATSTGTLFGTPTIQRADFHHFLDELAVHYGIL